jgi:hypothetical protein
MATTIRAVKTGTIRIRPSHRATDMSKPRWRRRLAIILDRDWTQPLLKHRCFSSSSGMTLVKFIVLVSLWENGGSSAAISPPPHHHDCGPAIS